MKKLIVLLLLTQFSCKSNHGSRHSSDTLTNSSFPVKPLIICPDTDEYSDADMRLSIVNITDNDSGKTYKAFSSYRGENIGFLVSVPKASGDKRGFGNNIIFQSAGKESDNFLKLQASLYKLKIANGVKFVKSFRVGYVDMGAFAKSIAPGAENSADPNVNEYKLFFESDKGEAEIYLNINPTNKWIELQEKDQEYRPLIIKMLTRSE